MQIKTSAWLIATIGFMSTASGVAAQSSDVADWSGLYGGVAVSALGGQNNFSLQAGRDFDFDENLATGVFVGYNWQRERLVYGLEGSVTSGFEGTTSGAVLRREDTLENVFELRGRVGFASGKFMTYGFVGYAEAGWNLSQFNREWDLDGMSYGFGVEYMATDQLLVGAEFSRRDFDGLTGLGTETQDLRHDLFSIKIGYKF